MTITIQNREIPVLLLTGYLGSGKTTLLNRILNNRKGIRFAVIVNDIGEVNIDADLIQKGGVVGSTDDSLVPLQNGCICCTLKMDLVNQLNDLCRADRFDYIVIEASGICEPAPIAQTICGAPSMLPEYARGNTPKLDCIVTVVDALRMQSEFDCGEALRKDEIGEEDIENLVIQQIEFCNIVLLNKVSEVTPSELGRVKAIVAALNPKAEIIECDWCDVDFDRILGTGKFDFDKVATSAAWIAAIEGDLEADGDDDDDEADESAQSDARKTLKSSRKIAKNRYLTAEYLNQYSKSPNTSRAEKNAAKTAADQQRHLANIYAYGSNVDKRRIDGGDYKKGGIRDDKTRSSLMLKTERQMQKDSGRDRAGAKALAKMNAKEGCAKESALDLFDYNPDYEATESAYTSIDDLFE